MNKDEILLKKWELLWNHYKLQNECVEKRRNFLWIIQAFIFTGWYYCSKDTSANFSRLRFSIMFILSIAGFLIGILWFLILRRERKSILITEMALRDVEVEWNSLFNGVELNRFILDKLLLRKKGEHKFKYIDDKFKKLWFFGRRSASWILNNIIPALFIFLWIFLIYLQERLFVSIDYFIRAILWP